MAGRLAFSGGNRCTFNRKADYCAARIGKARRRARLNRQALPIERIPLGKNNELRRINGQWYHRPPRAGYISNHKQRLGSPERTALLAYRFC